jgi:hypothetical protein
MDRTSGVLEVNMRNTNVSKMKKTRATAARTTDDTRKGRPPSLPASREQGTRIVCFTDTSSENELMT